jgi:hypothetical protein
MELVGRSFGYRTLEKCLATTAGPVLMAVFVKWLSSRVGVFLPSCLFVILAVFLMLRPLARKEFKIEMDGQYLYVREKRLCRSWLSFKVRRDDLFVAEHRDFWGEVLLGHREWTEIRKISTGERYRFDAFLMVGKKKMRRLLMPYSDKSITESVAELERQNKGRPER